MLAAQAVTSAFHAGRVVKALLQSEARRSTLYQSPKSVITATRRHRPDKRDTRLELLLKLGAPNYREKKFIARCQKAGESFPVKKVQVQWWPPLARKKTIVNKSSK